MQSIIRWTVGLGILWFVSTIGIVAIGAMPEFRQEAPILAAMAAQMKSIGEQLATFISPILQLALILVILIAAAERFGFTAEKRDWSGFAALGAANNVQAFIAVVIVGALVIGALAGIARVDILKDIALVVVGFYFGTRRSQASIDEAVQVGTMAGVAAAQARPEPPPPITQGGRGLENTNPVS